MSVESSSRTADTRRPNKSKEYMGSRQSGAIPTTVAALLTLGSILLTIIVATYTGIPIIACAVLSFAGILVGTGVRMAGTQRYLSAVSGASLLWIGAVTALIGISITISSIDGGISALPIGGAFGVGAVLSPACFLAATHHKFGTGLGKTAVSRFFGGVGVLAALTAPFLLGAVLNPDSILNAFQLGGSGDTSSAVVVLCLYIATSYILNKAIHTFPVEPFATPSKLPQTTRAKENVMKTVRYSRYVTVLVIYLFLMHSGGISLQQTEAVAQTIAAALTHTAVTVSLGTVIVTSVIVIATIRVTRQVKDVTAAGAAASLIPPSLLTLTVWTGLLLPNATLPTAVRSVRGNLVSQTGTVLPEVTAAFPAVPILLLLAVGAVIIGIIIAIPSAFARIGIGANSVGVTTGVAGLFFIIGVGIVANAPPLAVIGTVLAGLVIWDMGKFTVTAVTELQTPAGHTQSPRGFGSLATTHIAITTISVVILGVITGVMSIIVSGVSLTATTATLVLVLSGVGLVVTVKLLPP